MTPVRLEPGAPQSRVKHSTTNLYFLIEQSERYTLSHKVVSGSDIMLCNKLDKPPVIDCFV